MNTFGLVEYSKHSEEAEYTEWCRIRPSHYQNNKGEWTVIVDRISNFPDEGLVYWPRPDAFIDEGSEWFFETVEVEEKRGPDAHFVKQKPGPRMASLSLIESPGFGDIAGLRAALASNLITTLHSPTPIFMIAVPGGKDEYVGPFSHDEIGQFDPSLGLQKEVRLIEPHLIEEIPKAGGICRYVIGALASTELIGHFPVQDDRSLISMLSEDVRRYSKLKSAEFEPALNVLRDISSELSRPTVTLNTRSEVMTRVDAVDALIAHTEDVGNEFGELIAALGSHPDIRSILREDLDKELREEWVELNEQIANEFAGKKQQQSELDAQITERTETLAELDERLETAVDSAVDGMLEFSLKDAALTRILASNKASQRTGQMPFKPYDATRIDSLDDLHGAILAKSQVYDFHHLDLMSAVASLVTAGTVFVGGARSPILAQALAEIVRGDLWAVARVSPTVFGGDEFFSLPCTLDGETAATSTIGDLLRMPPVDDRNISLVIEGVNLAPPEAFLGQVIAPKLLGNHDTRHIAYRSPSGAVRAAPLFQDTMTVWTFSDGSSIYPLPTSIKLMIPVVDSNRRNAMAVDIPGSSLYSISSDLIDELRSEGLSQGPGSNAEIVGKAVDAVGSNLGRHVSIFAHVFQDEEIGALYAINAFMQGRASTSEIIEIASGIASELGDKYPETFADDANDRFINLLNGNSLGV
jgi:hypothetical protein